MKDYKTIQVLASIAMLGGPLSLIIGGVLLSTAALVCGIVALVLLRNAMAAQSVDGTDAIAASLKRQAVIGIAVSAVALVLNAAALATLVPAMMEVLQTGDYSSLLGSDGSSSAGSSSGGAFDSAPNGSGSGANSGNAGSGRSSAWG